MNPVSQDPWYESPLDRQVREALERGDFDDLPGAGRPLPPGEPDGGATWLRKYLEREGLSSTPLLPIALQLRREVAALAGEVTDMPSEQAVRDVVAELNVRIIRAIRTPPPGPAFTLQLVDVEQVVAGWRDVRSRVPDPLAARLDPDDPRAEKSRKWSRRRRSPRPRGR